MTMNKIPKGKLLIIGGAEDKGEDGPEIRNKNKDFEHLEILKELLPKGRNKCIEIITTASREPEQISKAYLNAFKRIGFNKVKFMHIDNNHVAKNPNFINRINKAHAILFSGGDQFRLSTIIGNTDVLETIMERYMTDSDFIIAGTSAGAMVAATLMIYEAENNEALLKGAVKISSGLGFIDHCIIDTHFIKRGRFGRLAQAIVMNPTCIGIGLGEDTALIIKKGNHAECRGSGMVVVIDGKEIEHTNIPYAEENTPLCIENLKVHILAKGNGFLLHERKFIPSKHDLREEGKNALALHNK
jgi:cyanophycinase